MQGTTHLTGALLAGALVAQRAGAGAGDWQTIAGGLALAGLAGLVPDWLQVNLPGVNHALRGVTGHRGITHWGITPGIVYLVCLVLFPAWAGYLGAGWLTHILLDLVAGGTPALWPVYPKRVHLANIKTGGKLDTLTGAGLLILAVVITGGLIL